MSGAVSGPRQRNARGSGQALRAEIVAAARAVLVEDGYESAVTLRGIARRIGIAAPSVYLHFPGPDEIVQAVVVETFGELGRAIADATEGVEPPRDRLVAGCRAYISFGLDNPNLYGLLFRRNRLLRGQEPRPETAAADRDPEAGPFAILMAGVRDCIADGSSRATDVLPIAVQLWAALHGLVLLRDNDYQFSWPDLAQLELDLVESIAQLRPAG